MVNRAQEFGNFNEIDSFFKNFNSTGFVDWFNRYVSTSGNTIWYNEAGGPIKINKLGNWQNVWNQIPLLFNRDKINLVEFLCMNSIITNETGGTFFPKSEAIGTNGHPGISYLFDKIDTSKLKKQSYNTLSTNKDALSLFNDAVYKEAHSNEPLSSLKDSTDNRWASQTFPQGFSAPQPLNNEVTPSGKTNTFLTNADFMKFRGRGYIQTTGRTNYIELISFVMNYNGADSIINKVKSEWDIYAPNLDSIASASLNSQWDDLFQKTNILACKSVYIHATKSEKINKNIYSIIDPNQSESNLQKAIRFMGKKVSGGEAYANKFLQRVLLQLEILDKNQPAIIQATPIKNEVVTQQQEAGRLERTSQDPNSQIGNNNNIVGTIPTITNVFGPSIKPSAISFNMDGN
jgi:hypothetical protein